MNQPLNFPGPGGASLWVQPGDLMSQLPPSGLWAERCVTLGAPDGLYVTAPFRGASWPPWLMPGQLRPSWPPCLTCPLYLGTCLSLPGLGPPALLVSCSREELDPPFQAQAVEEIAPNGSATSLLTLSNATTRMSLSRPQTGRDL